MIGSTARTSCPAVRVRPGSPAPPVSRIRGSSWARHRGDVRAFTKGRLSLGPGTLYGTIKRLLDAGLVEDLGSPSPEDDDPRRRYYRITVKGRRALELETEGLASVLGVAKRRLKTS